MSKKKRKSDAAKASPRCYRVEADVVGVKVEGVVPSVTLEEAVEFVSFLPDLAVELHAFLKKQTALKSDHIRSLGGDIYAGALLTMQEAAAGVLREVSKSSSERGGGRGRRDGEDVP